MMGDECGVTYEKGLAAPPYHLSLRTHHLLRSVATVGLMRLDELSAGDGRAHREFPGEQCGGDDLGELGGAARSRAAEHLKALAARAQLRPAADRGDRE